jgi:hypothetical protein
LQWALANGLGIQGHVSLLHHESKASWAVELPQKDNHPEQSVGPVVDFAEQETNLGLAEWLKG